MAGLDAVTKWAEHLERGADGMEKDGVGGHAHNHRSHVALIRRVAAAMRADHASGKVPHELVDTGPRYYGSADNTLSAAAAVMNAAVAESMGAKGAGLPPHIDRLLTEHGVTLPPGAVPVAELQAKLKGMTPGNRIIVKHALTALGRIAA